MKSINTKSYSILCNFVIAFGTVCNLAINDINVDDKHTSVVRPQENKDIDIWSQIILADNKTLLTDTNTIMPYKLIYTQKHCLMPSRMDLSHKLWRLLSRMVKQKQKQSTTDMDWSKYEVLKIQMYIQSKLNCSQDICDWPQVWHSAVISFTSTIFLLQPQLNQINNSQCS